MHHHDANNTHTSIFYDDLKPSELGQVNVSFSLCDQGSLVGLCAQDYIGYDLFHRNKRRDAQTDRQPIISYMKISAS